MANPNPPERETRVVSGGEKRGLETDLLIGGAVAAGQFSNGFLSAAGHDAWDKLKDTVSGGNTPEPPASSEEGDR